MKTFLLRSTAVVAATLFAGAAAAAPVLTVNQVWTAVPEETSEIVAFDKSTNQVFTASGSQVEVLDFATGAAGPSLSFDPNANGDVNSVAVSNGMLAVAVAGPTTTSQGSVYIYDTSNLAAAPQQISVGVLPDMLTFTPDGSQIIVANEGEPEGYDPGQIDPVGSVSVINVADLSVKEATFTAFDGQEAALRAAGVRIFGPGSSVSQDLEPEYVAVSSDGATAYVALQENNALAIVDLSGADPTVTDIVPLGFKDYGLPGNEIDPSDDDNVVSFSTQPGVLGMYQPDGIGTITIAGTEYLVSANEGDARDYDGLEEEDRVRDLTLAPGAFPANAQDDDQLGRLEITLFPGIDDAGINGSGEFEKLYSYGGRSFSLWDDNGNLVFDSGSFVDQTLADLGLYPDSRSDAKGAEPEAIEVGIIDGRTYLFLGLERASAIMIFDMTDFDLMNLTDDMLVAVITDPVFGRPEGLDFISAADSPDGFSYLLAAFEGGGGTDEGTALYRLTQVSEPATLGIFGVGLIGLGLKRRRKRA